MREVIGIIVGILGFLSIAVYTVKQYEAARPPQSKSARPPLSPSPALPPSSSHESPVGASPVPLQSPTPQVPPIARPAEPPVTPTTSLTTTPFSRPAGSPDMVIYFRSGCTGLSHNDRTALNGIVPALRKTPDARIEIHGHTDDMGHTQFNHDLSRLRADIVHYYLQAQGIAASRFTVGGQGSSSPASPKKSVIGRQRNRRTEVFIHRESLRKS